MSFFRRALLYLARKKQRTILLFFILVVVITLVLLCLTAGHGVDIAAERLRETMVGYFKVRTNTEQGYSEVVTDDLVLAAEGVENIKASNGLDIVYMYADDLELSPGRFSASGEKDAKLARFLGNTDSSLNEYFVLENFTLSQGRHIGPEDEGKAVISETLAAGNGLSIGDTFTATPETGSDAKAHTFQIVGIFQVNTGQEGDGFTAECDIQANFIFTDTASVRAIYGARTGRNINFYNSGILFFVRDPRLLGQTIEELQKEEAYSDEAYKVIVNNQAYQTIARPLERMNSMITVIILILLMISAIILALVLFLWSRDRVRETGILLASGIRKIEIFGQHLTENLLVAILAFLVSLCLGAAASNQMNDLLSHSIAGNEEDIRVDDSSGIYENQAAAVRAAAATGALHVEISGYEAAEVAGIGILLLTGTTALASVVVLRIKPRKILASGE